MLKKIFNLALITGAVDGFTAASPGGCPKAVPFDLDMVKLAGKSFKILYAFKTGGPHVGQHCEEIKYEPFEDGKNSSRWQMHLGSKESLSMLTDHPELSKKFVNYNNQGMVLVFSEHAREQGVTNVAEVFSSRDF